MRTLVTITVASILVAIAALHFFWAAGGKLAILAAVPSSGGVPAFKPGAVATATVGLALLAAAALIAAAGDLWRVPAGDRLVAPAACLLALVFAARAIGDFRSLGFFKTNPEGSFAVLDTYGYSPLCALLATAIAYVVAS